jgi:hypothetical protein
MVLNLELALPQSLPTGYEKIQVGTYGRGFSWQRTYVAGADTPWDVFRDDINRNLHIDEGDHISYIIVTYDNGLETRIPRLPSIVRANRPAWNDALGSCSMHRIFIRVDDIPDVPAAADFRSPPLDAAGPPAADSVNMPRDMTELRQQRWEGEAQAADSVNMLRDMTELRQRWEGEAQTADSVNMPRDMTELRQQRWEGEAQAADSVNMPRDMTELRRQRREGDAGGGDDDDDDDYGGYYVEDDEDDDEDDDNDNNDNDNDTTGFVLGRHYTPRILETDARVGTETCVFCHENFTAKHPKTPSPSCQHDVFHFACMCRFVNTRQLGGTWACPLCRATNQFLFSVV